MNKVYIIFYGAILLFILNLIFHLYVFKKLSKERQIAFKFTFVGLFISSLSMALGVVTNEIEFFAKIFFIGFIVAFIGSIIHFKQVVKDSENL